MRFGKPQLLSSVLMWAASDRVVGTVSNMPEFWKAFGCKAGQPMVRGEAACCAW